MSTWAGVTKEAIVKEVQRVEQGLVGLISSFDKETMRADVKPLQADPAVGNSAPVPLPVLPSIPVSLIYAGDFYIRPNYQEGDMVWVSFATRDIASSLRGETLERSKRVFDLSSASVAYAIAPTDWTPPAEFSEDGLLIGHKDGDAYLKFESDKVTAYFDGGDKKVEWSDGGMRFWNGTAWTNFATHVHPTAAAGPPSPPTPGT